MNDWDDRLLDASLQELHGSRPPDLSSRVLNALQEGSRGPLPVLRSPSTVGPVGGGGGMRWWSLAALLLAAVTLGFAVALGAFANDASPLQPQGASSFPVEVTVRSGRLECVVHDQVVAQATPERPAVFPIATGTRLHGKRASSFQLGPFGSLVVHEDTLLEVRSMEFTKQHGMVAATSLTLAVVAGVVTWQVMARTEAANAGQIVRMEAQNDDMVALRAENQRLKDALAAATVENQTLHASTVQRDPVVLQKPPEPEPVEAPKPNEPAVAVAATFDDAKYADLLAKLDWKTMGTVTAEMGPMLAELVAAMQKEGAELPMDLLLKIQKLNMKLIDQVPALLESGLPGFGPNGSYTHPLVVGNTLASTLDAAGQPLTAAQKQSIGGLVRAFAAESQAIAEASREYDLEQLLAETEMKDRFFREMGGVLQPEQSGVIFPPGAGTHDGSSLFSSGLVTQIHGQPVAAKDAADFARVASSKLAEQLGLDEAGANQVRAVLARGVSAPELWQTRGDGAENNLHMMRSGRTHAALRAQIAWMKQIQQTVALTPEQQQKLAKMKNVLVPVPR